MPTFNRSGIRRSGDDYQDLFGLEILIDWLEHPDRYQWVRLEASDFAGSLDDVTALRSDDKFVARQIKWTSCRDEHMLSWDWILQKDPRKPRQKSLLEKWSESFSSLCNDHECKEAAVYTNRQIESSFEPLLDNYRRIDSDRLGEAIKVKITSQIGSEKKMVKFFTAFQFHADHSDYTVKRDSLSRRFQNLGGDQQGFNNLLENIRDWVKLKKHHILLEDIRRAAQWTVLEDIYQGFNIPDSYVLPDNDFYQNFKTRLLHTKERLTVLTGAPGVGKSTLLSYLKQELKKDDDIPVIRHHYYLSQDDTTGDRYSWAVVSQSLMGQIKENHSRILGDLCNKNPNPKEFRSWLEQCGAAYMDEKKPFILIIDGLDHVYREQETKKPLIDIFENLLPVPENIVLVLGTRNVDDAYFPKRFLDAAPNNHWVDLPFMNENAVRQWVEYYSTRVGVPEAVQQRDYKLNEVSKALFKKSNGYPLHLTYTLQALLDRGKVVNEKNISALPACPDNDIKHYYDSLMRTLYESGQIMLHILCDCGFKWPEGALSECLSPNYGTIPNIKKTEREIHHLLKRDRLGFSVYHTSLEEYTCSLPDHNTLVKQAYPLVITWLEKKAPQLWRWSHLWIIKQKNNESAPLINGPTEEWLAHAFLKGYPLYQIKDILERAAWAALEKNDLIRTLQLNLMNDYAHAAADYQTNGLQRLLFCQLRESWSDSFLKIRLLSEPYVLNGEELALCAEKFSQNNQVENVRVLQEYFENECFTQKPSGAIRQEHDRWDNIHYLDIIASLKPENASRTLDWVREFDEDRRNFTQHLRRLVSLKASTPLQNIAKLGLEPKEAWIAARSLSHFASNQSVRISSWELCEEIKKTSLMQVHLLIKEAEVKVPYFPFMNIEIFNRSHREIYGPQPEFTGFYHDMFFSSMLLHLKAAGPYENLWLRKLDVVHDWVVETCNWLGEIAKRTAEIVIAGNIPNAAWLYSQFENIHVPRDIHHSPEGVYCRYFQWALIDISYDLQMLSENTKIEIDDLKTIVESKHFRKELWLDNFIDLRSETFLSDDALNWLCEREAKYLSQTVKQFNERYEDYMRIAQICTLQGQHMLSEQYSKLAVGDALAINHHKDSFLFGLSDIILNCAKAGIEETQGWLSKLGHFIDHVTECTDGDETDHVQLDFGEALLHIQPDKFSAFYKLYLDKEEWYHCDNLLSRFNKGADTSDPVYDAILETYVERNDRYDSSHDNVNDREKDQIDFSAFPPENLEKFLNKLDRQNLIFNKAYFHGWLDHWSAQQHQKPKILEAMKAVAAKDTFLPFRTGNYHNIMLQLTLDVLGKDAAYPILLQAQQENYGWSVHGTWKESEARFHMIAQNWPEKWLDFIKDTALPSKAYSKRGFSPSFGLSRLVQYLLILHKKDIVVEIGNMLTNFTLDRSKHMAFPASLWVEAFENCYGFIPLLFSRLDWPDVNIREEASQQIVILLKKDQYKNQIKEYYWQWLLTRVFESQCVTATVLFYKCRLENKNIFTDEDLEKLIMNLPAPSALSWMLLSEIKGEKFDPEPDYSTIHSGDTPHAYEIPDYFIDYKTALLPLIYDMRAEFLQRKGVIGFRRQWAYEITCLYERENIKARYPYAHYFINRGTQKRVSIFDLPQSEVFRSAYLRALAWAYDDGYIDKANMMFNVMSFCPVEFCSWQAKPIEGPNFWPRIHNTSQDIDQTPEQVFQSLENILLMDYSPDQVIGSASAPVSFHTNEHDGNIETFYDLSIYGLFQKNVESDGDINPKEIIKQLQKNKNIDVNRLTLNLEGPLPPVNVNEKLAVSGGTVFVPATLAIRAGPIAHWQNEQMYRGIDVGAPYLAKEQPILKPEENKLLLKIGDQILSETSYWSFQKLEYWPENCPPPLGVCTLVSKEDIVRFCDTQSVSFCWLVQLEFYYRKERSDEFSKKNFYKFYEFSNIILNQ